MIYGFDFAARNPDFFSIIFVGDGDFLIGFTFDSTNVKIFIFKFDKIPLMVMFDFGDRNKPISNVKPVRAPDPEEDEISEAGWLRGGLRPPSPRAEL